jgi:hypothetical protein
MVAERIRSISTNVLGLEQKPTTKLLNHGCPTVGDILDTFPTVEKLHAVFNMGIVWSQVCQALRNQGVTESDWEPLRIVCIVEKRVQFIFYPYRVEIRCKNNTAHDFPSEESARRWLKDEGFKSKQGVWQRGRARNTQYAVLYQLIK